MSVRVNDSVVIPDSELSWRFSRSSGPGGQGVNTTDSRVELSFDISESATLPSALRQRAISALSGRLREGVLTIAASGERSQLRNRKVAEQRLGQLLREAVAPPLPSRRATRPSRRAVRRRKESKQRRSEVKRLRRRVN